MIYIVFAYWVLLAICFIKVMRHFYPNDPGYDIRWPYILLAVLAWGPIILYLTYEHKANRAELLDHGIGCYGTITKFGWYTSPRSDTVSDCWLYCDFIVAGDTISSRSNLDATNLDSIKVFEQKIEAGSVSPIVRIIYSAHNPEVHGIHLGKYNFLLQLQYPAFFFPANYSTHLYTEFDSLWSKVRVNDSIVLPPVK